MNVEKSQIRGRVFLVASGIRAVGLDSGDLRGGRGEGMSLSRGC